MATFIAPVARAQYPQITEEAKQAYQKMMSEERRRSDEAWAKRIACRTERSERRSSVYSWASVHTICRRHEFLLSPGAEGGGMYSFGVVAVR